MILSKLLMYQPVGLRIGLFENVSYLSLYSNIYCAYDTIRQKCLVFFYGLLGSVEYGC